MKSDLFKDIGHRFNGCVVDDRCLVKQDNSVTIFDGFEFETSEEW